MKVHRLRGCAAALVVALVLPAGGLAGTSCDLESARRAFALGRVSEVEELVATCLAEDVDRPLRAEAFALLAKSLLELDQADRAAEAVRGVFAADQEYRASADDPIAFVRLVDELRPTAPIRVTSVSKGGESLRRAPATVAVVTGEQIRRRGYHDLEAVLHDLPGFDISRVGGYTYSVLFPRGLTSGDSDRLLLVIDGVEQNALYSNLAYLSRQYPLSNVDRVEVVYGPASTMYGVNAFSGVINVITRSGSDLVEPGKKIGVDAQLSGGSWSTWCGDVTVGGVGMDGDLSWSLTARAFRSDGFELSGYPEWDFQAPPEDTYRSYSWLNPHPDDWQYQWLLDQYGLAAILETGWYELVSETLQLRLTEAGLARVRALDQAAYDQPLDGHPLGFSNPVDDWSVGGRVSYKGFELGLQVWRRQEAYGASLTDEFFAGAENGSWEVPKQTSLYARYSARLAENFTLTSFLQYRSQEFDDPTGYQFLVTYRRPSLDAVDLMEGTPAYWDRRYYYHHASQLRTEVNALWRASDRLSVVTGVELRDSTIETRYTFSSEPHPSDTGERPPALSVLDLGAFSQATFSVTSDLSLAAGLRYDRNQIGATGGYGSSTTPRLALVFSRPVWTAKVVYAEGFKDATLQHRYNEENPDGNPNLDPERTRNTELSLAWHPDSALSLELATFDTRFTDAIDVIGGRFENADGEARVRGLQAVADWRTGPLAVSVNYTYTDPDEQRGLTVAKIAPHKANLVVDLQAMSRLSVVLRANWVDDRPVGAGTTAHQNPLTEIDGFTVVNSAITYQNVLPGADLQLVVDNLLDEDYAHAPRGNYPAFVVAAEMPQPGRSFFLRLLYRY